MSQITQIHPTKYVNYGIMKEQEGTTREKAN